MKHFNWEGVEVRHRRDKCFRIGFVLLFYSQWQTGLPELAISSNYFQVFSKTHKHLIERHMYHNIGRIVLEVIYRKELQPSSKERHFSNKACLIRKRMEERKSNFNEPGNVMHLAQQLWWECIDSNMNAWICVAIHVSCCPDEKEHSCSITWVSTSM